MVTDLMDYRRRYKLKNLNRLVKELLEVRQYLRFFEGLHLPDYEAMISNLPQGAETGLLRNLHQRQSVEFFSFLELKAREERLKEAIQRASDDVDKIL